jgi:hypothetical protein
MALTCEPSTHVLEALRLRSGPTEEAGWLRVAALRDHETGAYIRAALGQPVLTPRVGVMDLALVLKPCT